SVLDRQESFSAQAAQLDEDFTTRLVVLNRIAQQVHNDLSQAQTVAKNLGAVQLGRQAYLPRLGQRLQLGDALFDHPPQIDPLAPQVQLTRISAGQSQQPVYKSRHRARGSQARLNRLTILGNRARPAQGQFSLAAQDSQRGAQLMRGVRG